MAEISPLRRRMLEDMTVRNLSPATQQSYIYAVSKFSRHFGRSPDHLGPEDVRTYQLHLIARQLSWSHINQTVSALRFFYGVTLGRPDANQLIVAAREPQRLPVVLSGDEVIRFLEAVPGLRNRVALTTAYGAGLRVGEVASLETSAIDSSRMLIRIQHGKGGQDPSREAPSGSGAGGGRALGHFSAPCTQENGEATEKVSEARQVRPRRG